MSSPNVQILPEGVGYAVVVGMGAAFSLVMVGLTWAQHRYTPFKGTADEFNTASRSVKPGLIASGIVSAWTWAATLLQSTSVAYSDGVSGPFWYASGATVQVFLFAMLAVKVKQNANGARTWLEIVRARYGTSTHIVYLFFGLATNIIVSSMLLLGGSAVVNALTGADIYAANFLIPIGVAFYVYFGGLRATLLCDWSHTTALVCIILYFSFAFYTSGLSSSVGSPSAMYDLLTQAAAVTPVASNTNGSYLTMRSVNGLIFGIINVVGNFGTVFLDQVYFQRAIASRPETAVKAYLLGGIAWFPIPFTFATTMGLGAVALGITLAPSQVSAGLVAPAAAATLLGTGGAAALLILLFLAVTSAASAEIIAVSSIMTFDVYKTYINPNASQQQIVNCGHIAIAGYAIFMGAAASVLNAIGLSLGWLYLFMGVVIGAGVVPLALTICWSKTNKTGVIVAPIAGLCCAMFAWLLTTGLMFDGVFTIATTGSNYPMLAGNLVSIGVGAIVVLAFTLAKPDNYDFGTTRAIGTDLSTEQQADLTGTRPSAVQPDSVGLTKAFRLAAMASIALTFAFIILLPMPMFGAEYVFSRGFFTAWVVIAIMWTFISGFIVVLFPIFESRLALKAIVVGLWTDMTTGGKGAAVQQQEPVGKAEPVNPAYSKPMIMDDNQKPNSYSPDDVMVREKSDYMVGNSPRDELSV